MSDLLIEEEIVNAQKDYIERTWQEAKVTLAFPLVGYRRDECLMQAQNAKTKKGILESLLSDIAVELDADQSLGEFYNNIHHKYHKWQDLKKEVEDG